MALLDSLLNLVRTGRLSDSELLQFFQSIKDKRPDLFDATKIQIYSENLAHESTTRPFLRQPEYKFGSLNHKLNKDIGPYLELKTDKKLPIKDSSSDKKFSSIAVVLIGEWRTGSLVSEYMHKFFNSMAEKVDYYIATYNNVSEETVLESYPNADVRLLDPSDGTYFRGDTVFIRRAGFCLAASELIESKLSDYDQIVETRPDHYIRIADSISYVECKENECIDTRIFYSLEKGTVNRHRKVYPLKTEIYSMDIDLDLFKNTDQNKRQLLTTDLYTRMHPKTFIKYAKRFDELKDDSDFYYYDPHTLTARYLLEHKIKYVGHDFNISTIIRNPDIKYIDIENLSADDLEHLNLRTTENSGGPKLS